MFTFVHALPPDVVGSVDVYLDGADDPVLTDIGFREVDVFELEITDDGVPLEVTPAGEPGTVLLSTELSVTFRNNTSVVAHLDAAGTPVLLVAIDVITEEPRGFSTPTGQGCLSVRHVAAAPPVAVAVTGAEARTDIPELANGGIFDPDGLVLDDGVLEGCVPAGHTRSTPAWPPPARMVISCPG